MIAPGMHPEDARFARAKGYDPNGLTPVNLPPDVARLEIDSVGRASAARSVARADGSDQRAFRLNAWLRHGPRQVEPGTP
mgnify:CR=1 FL=1